MRQKEFFIISLTIFFTVIAWMIADIYHIAKMEKIKLKSSEVIKLINFNIAPQIFKTLKEKQ
jgi:hypothetical protein